MKSLVFFNNKGGVGKTTLVYHFSYMLANLGYKVLCVDLDPQSNLTSMMLSEEKLEEIYNDADQRNYTILDAIRPSLKGTGDVRDAHIESISERLSLLLGDLELSTFEDRLSENWPKCLDRREDAFRVISSFYRVVNKAGKQVGADYIVLDVGPNLGAINRTALISVDFVVMPVAADLFSLQGIKNLGKSLEEWRNQWKERLQKNPEPSLELPKGIMTPIGYVVIKHGANVNRIYKAYEKFANRIPPTYLKYVLKSDLPYEIKIEDDKNCLGFLKYYYSLIPMAMEARKPVFSLKPSDGAIGAHFQSVQKVYEDIQYLTKSIISRINEEEKTLGDTHK